MMTNPKNISGRRIAAARKQKSPRLTQHDLSAFLLQNRTNMNRATIAKIEIGLRGVLDYELLAISKILDVSLDWLLSGSTEPAAEAPVTPRPVELEEPAPELPERPERDENRALIFL